MLNNCEGSSEYLNVSPGIDARNEHGETRKETSNKRMKWTDDMVKLVITALSYLVEDDYAVVHCKCENGRFVTNAKPPGKWRVISNVMVQRGFQASPHQCEDKFNDLNKKYRRLNTLLGRGTACQVVENPKLIDSMDLSNVAVEEVKKILSSRQLFYREMCSYHNQNRLFLPHRRSIQNLLKVAVESKGNGSQELVYQIPEKMITEGEDHEVIGPKSAFDCHKWMQSRLLRLEEQNLRVLNQRLELERFLIESQQEDLELEKMRLENKIIRLENQRLAFEIRQQTRKVLGGQERAGSRGEVIMNQFDSIFPLQ